MKILYLLVKFGGKIYTFSWVGKPISGLTSGPEVENMTLQKLRVNCIHPPSFILIGPAISEKKVPDT